MSPLTEEKKSLLPLMIQQAEIENWCLSCLYKHRLCIADWQVWVTMHFVWPASACRFVIRNQVGQSIEHTGISWPITNGFTIKIALPRTNDYNNVVKHPHVQGRLHKVLDDNDCRSALVRSLANCEERKWILRVFLEAASIEKHVIIAVKPRP